MTTRQLSFKSLPPIAAGHGTTTPDPGIPGVWAWSTALDAPIYWDGSMWVGLPTQGTGVIGGAVTLDFGTAAQMSTEATVTVTGQSGISALSNIKAWIQGTWSTDDHTADEHIMARSLIDVTVGNIVDNIGFTIYGLVRDGTMAGSFVVNWEWN